MDYSQTVVATRIALSSGTDHGTAEASQLWRKYLCHGSTNSREAALAEGHLAEVLAMQGRAGEAGELFSKSLETLVDPLDRIKVLCGYANMLCSARLTAEARTVRDSLLESLATERGAVSEDAPWAYAYLASLEAMLGDDMAAAFDYANCAVEVATSQTPARGRAEAYMALSAVHEAGGNLPAARDALSEAMVSMKEGHCLMEARARYGRISLALGETETAVRSFHRAVEFADFRDQRILGHVLQAIASMYDVDPPVAKRLTEGIAARLLSPPAKRREPL